MGDSISKNPSAIELSFVTDLAPGVGSENKKTLQKLRWGLCTVCQSWYNQLNNIIFFFFVFVVKRSLVISSWRKQYVGGPPDCHGVCWSSPSEQARYYFLCFDILDIFVGHVQLSRFPRHRDRSQIHQFWICWIIYNFLV